MNGKRLISIHLGMARRTFIRVGGPRSSIYERGQKGGGRALKMSRFAYQQKKLTADYTSVYGKKQAGHGAANATSSVGMNCLTDTPVNDEGEEVDGGRGPGKIQNRTPKLYLGREKARTE